VNQLPQRAFREFVSAHADRIYNHALRMLGKREEAEEAVQDIFLKVHKGMANFRGESSVKTWLYRITVNTCLTRLKKRASGQREFSAEESEEGYQWETIISDRDNPEERFINKELYNFVMKAMELITAEEKEIILLFHVDGLKYEEIANILDVPIGTVCARLYRARRHLRVAMGFIQNEIVR
jgi:RNA polymerase sigma-70 factor (ECF subfamily)